MPKLPSSRHLFTRILRYLVPVNGEIGEKADTSAIEDEEHRALHAQLAVLPTRSTPAEDPASSHHQKSTQMTTHGKPSSWNVAAARNE